MARKSAKKLVQAGLFAPQEVGSEEQEGALPPSRNRDCGRCKLAFWSEVQTRRPTFVPLFCRPCGKIMAMGLRMRPVLSVAVKGDFRYIRVDSVSLLTGGRAG